MSDAVHKGLYKVVAVREIKIVNDSTMSHFSKILQQRERQITRDILLVHSSEKKALEKVQRSENSKITKCSVLLWRGFPLSAAASSCPPLAFTSISNCETTQVNESNV